MTDMIDDKPKNEKPMPPPPEDPIDPDRVEAAQERWTECPLKDCKRDVELLYADFYLRDVRTNRVMCSACAVRTEIGYIAKEVVKASDDRFFTGNLSTDVILFGVMFVGSIVANIIAQFVPFFYFTFLIGLGIGGGLASQARRLSGKKITRQTPYFGIGGIVIGALLAPTIYILMRFQVLILDPSITLRGSFIDILACSLGMIIAAWGVFMRRI